MIRHSDAMAAVSVVVLTRLLWVRGLLPSDGQSGGDPLILAGAYCTGQSTGLRESRKYSGCIGTPALDIASTCGFAPLLRRRRATGSTSTAPATPLTAICSATASTPTPTTPRTASPQ